MTISSFFVRVISSINQVISLLDSVAIEVGAVRISIFTLIQTFIVFSVVIWVTKLISQKIHQVLYRVIKNNSDRELAIKILDSTLYIVVFLISLRILGIDLAAFTVLGGAFGIGIGFGLQKITSNFISGLILLTEKSIEVDDILELGGDLYGKVKKLGARYILIETYDGTEIMVPNEDFMTNRVTNLTFSNSNGRIQIDIGVSYDSDIKKAMALILESAKEHPRCIKNPIPECFLMEFADSSVNFRLFFWVENVSIGRFQPRSDVLLSIWDKFKIHNISIPFPQRDVHIKDMSMLQTKVNTTEL